jgi:hypothetical protein
MSRELAILLIGFLFAGCQQIEQAQPRLAASDTPVQEKSYQLGIPQEAYVGSTMVRVREYHTLQSTQNSAVASSDFEVSAPLAFTKRGQRGSVYDIIGSTMYNGREYQVMKLEEYGLVLDESGRLMEKVINLSSGFNNFYLPTFEIRPPDVRFERQSDVTIDTSRPFTNYELLYSGIDGDTMRINYREYSPDNLARPAFFQDLTYPAGQSVVRFRDLRLEILSADSQQVRFRVMED